MRQWSARKNRSFLSAGCITPGRKLVSVTSYGYFCQCLAEVQHLKIFEATNALFTYHIITLANPEFANHLLAEEVNYDTSALCSEVTQIMNTNLMHHLSKAKGKEVVLTNQMDQTDMDEADANGTNEVDLAQIDPSLCSLGASTNEDLILEDNTPFTLLQDFTSLTLSNAMCWRSFYMHTKASRPRPLFIVAQRGPSKHFCKNQSSTPSEVMDPLHLL